LYLNPLSPPSTPTHLVFFSLTPAPPSLSTLSLPRRSSDLLLPCSSNSLRRPTQRRPPPPAMFRAASARMQHSARRSSTSHRRRRSEEHTSELQSRGHLVCRLLLEKKKTNHVKNQHSRSKNQ